MQKGILHILFRLKPSVEAKVSKSCFRPTPCWHCINPYKIDLDGITTSMGHEIANKRIFNLRMIHAHTRITISA